MTTANGRYAYSTIYFGRALSEWVNDAHAYLSTESNWTYNPLKPGAFGFDNMACSIASAFGLLTAIDDVCNERLDQIASLVHQGWADNYCYWRDREPWLLPNRTYTKPYNALGDERRNLCARRLFVELPPDEQEKDRIIARYLISATKGHKL